jgi:hypothetical protein
MCITVYGYTQNDCFKEAKKWCNDGYNIWSGVYEDKSRGKRKYCADLFRYKDLSDDDLKNVTVGKRGMYGNIKLFK